MVGILTKNSSEKSNAPHMPRVPPPLPPSALKLIHALVSVLSPLEHEYLLSYAKAAAFVNGHSPGEL